MAYHRHHGVDVRIVRIFNTFGPRMQIHDGRAIPNFFRQAIRGEDRHGVRRRHRRRARSATSTIWSRASGGCCAATTSGPVNIGNPREMTLRAMAEKIIEITGSAEPDRAPRAAAGRSEGAPARHLARAPRARLGAEGSRRGGPAPDATPTSARRSRRNRGPARDRSPTRIRNFCIIAHIDHGKSTLADRLLDATGSLTAREKRDQFLDKMDLERERGITIKAQTARMRYRARDGQRLRAEPDRHPRPRRFLLRGVARARGLRGRGAGGRRRAGHRGADARQRLARGRGRPRDHPGREQDRPALRRSRARGAGDRGRDRPRRRRRAAGLREGGQGHRRAARADRRARAAAAAAIPTAPPRALVFDSWFDPYVGAVMLVRVFDGGFHVGGRLLMMARGVEHEIQQLVRDRSASAQRSRASSAGEVGLVRRRHQVARRGARSATRSATPRARPPRPLPGFRDVKPMVFAGLYPVDPDDYENLKAALAEAPAERRLARLRARDQRRARLRLPLRLPRLPALRDRAGAARARVQPQPDLDRADRALPGGAALGRDAARSRARRRCRIRRRSEQIEEPMVLATIHVPPEYVGGVLALCQDRRGTQRDMAHHGSRVQVRYELPLSEIVVDFHDRIKSADARLRLLRLRAARATSPRIS